jgi:hypothetical protein
VNYSQGHPGPNELQPQELTAEQWQQVLAGAEQPTAFDLDGARMAMSELHVGSAFDLTASANVIQLASKRGGHFSQA